MAFLHGTSARFYYHTLDFSAYTEGVALEMGNDLAEFRPLSGSSVRRVPGQRTCRISLSGTVMDSDTHAAAWSALSDTSERVWAMLPAGDAVGGVAICGIGFSDTQQRVAGDDIVRLPITFLSSDDFDVCKILRNLSSGGTSPSALVNMGAAGGNGGRAYLLATEISSTLTVTVQHSDNGTDWSDLVVMSSLNTPGSEMKEVSGAVNRYLRVSWTGSGTWFLAFYQA